MLKVIINADDCGKDQTVNAHIEEAIIKGKVTSTTILANMDCFEGAIRLYKKYGEKVSFGVHLNFTEGQPLLYSQELLDIGFYKEDGGMVTMNGSSFRNNLISKNARESVYREMKEQMTKIKDSGVAISHIDSHHFIHHSLIMIFVLPKLCKEFNVLKTRRIRNYIPASFSRLARNLWPQIIKAQCDIKYTDWFTSFKAFHSFSTTNQVFYKQNDVIELMCHPGGIYVDEEDLLMNSNFIGGQLNCELINYNQL